MSDEIKEILEDVKRHLDYVEATKQCSIRDNEMKVMYDYITNLQEETKIIRKILIEHIDEARHELNVILQSDNDLNYKNECSREFEILDKNIRMILDKIDNILNGGDE